MEAASPPLIESRYVGGATTLYGELSVDGGRPAASAEVFGGLKLGRFISTEGFLTYRWSDAFREQASGEPCRWAPLDQWSWGGLGTRLWIHVFRSRVVQVMLAPRFTVGVAHVWQEANGNQRVTSCAHPALSFWGWALDGGIDFGFEVRAASWLGLRTYAAASVLGANAGSIAFGAISFGFAAGPVFRF